MARWPGNIREVHGLTEGGISITLDCAAHPDKWDSIGVPTEGAEVRIIDEDGNELPRGEIVGRAISIMRGYYNREAQDGLEPFGLDYNNPDFVKYAESYGATGHHAGSAEALQPTLRQTLEAVACIWWKRPWTTVKMTGSSTMSWQ